MSSCNMMSRYRSSSSKCTDNDDSSDTSCSEDWADIEDLPDEIFDGYEGKNLEGQVPCTAAEHRTCQIVDHLPTLNQLLCSIGLRLRELSEGDGQLAVVNSLTPDFIRSREQRRREAFECLAWLVKSHPCVTSLHVNSVFLEDIVEGGSHGVLKGNSSLKSLKVDSRSSSYKYCVSDIILGVIQLEKLEVLEKFLDMTIVEPISKVLHTKNLYVLKVFCYECIGDEEMDALLAALKASSSLRELSVNARLFSDTPERGKITFWEYLKNNTVLEKLNIYGNEHDFMRYVLYGMCQNKSVSELYLFGCFLDFITCLRLRDLLLQNAVLRSFTMTAIDGRHAPAHEKGFEAWLEALGKNRVLRYIRFPFAMIPRGRWCSLFETVSTHTSLNQVVVEVSGWQYEGITFKPHELQDGLHGALLDVCKILENSGAKRKVTFTFVGLESDPLDDAVPGPLPFPLLPGAITSPSMDLLKQLCSFDSCRMTELKVELSCLEGHSSGVSQFIKETTTLKKLFLSNRLAQNVPSVDITWSNILESLSQNTSIIEVSLRAIMESAENLRHLAKVVQSSTTIRTLKICLERSQMFPDCAGDLPVDISNNYSLCCFRILASFEISTMWAFDWLAWYNTSWRNSGIVARAARFVNGTMYDRRCASALETLSRHPALVAELAEVLTDAEAASLVRTLLSHVQDMHEFMRLAGVVRDRVTCEPREDGCKQLCDLNEDCWRHVMRYLKLDDICYPSETVDGTALQ